MVNVVTNMSVDVLKVHPRNEEFFDDISGEKYEQFKKSIQEDGIITPITVAPDMTIISGHQRYKAARDLGVKLVPVIIQENLTDETAKLKTLLAANFGREKNNESKQRKVIAEYVELCGYKNGEIGRHHFQDSQNGKAEKMSLEEIAKQLGTSKTNLTRALSIERNLTDSMKELLDNGTITKTLASDVIASLSNEEQEQLVSQLDATKRYTQKQIQGYIDEIRHLKQTPVKPDDYDYTKRQLQDYKSDYKNLQNQFEDKVAEVQELRKQIDTIKSTSPTEQYNKKLKDSTIFFCGKVADFIEKMGGYIWLTEHLSELPDYERKSYISAVSTINAWSNTILENINN